MSENNDYMPDLIELNDDEGNTYHFEVLDAIQTDTGYYLAMIPTEQDKKDILSPDNDLVIVKEEEENGEFYYSEIEDDDEYETVADAFSDRLAEFYDIEEKGEE